MRLNEAGTDDADSPYKAFAAGPSPTYELVPIADVPTFASSWQAGRRTRSTALDAAASVAAALGADVRAAALSADGEALRARGKTTLEVVRYTRSEELRWPVFDAFDCSTPAKDCVRDGDRLLEERAHGYLHANCSMCHRDGSATGVAELALRIDVPFDRTGLCLPPKAGTFGVADARIVAPGAPERSVLLHRMKALTSDERMPKLGSHVVDERGVAVIEEWIATLGACP